MPHDSQFVLIEHKGGMAYLNVSQISVIKPSDTEYNSITTSDGSVFENVLKASPVSAPLEALLINVKIDSDSSKDQV